MVSAKVASHPAGALLVKVVGAVDALFASTGAPLQGRPGSGVVPACRLTSLTQTEGEVRLESVAVSDLLRLAAPRDHFGWRAGVPRDAAHAG